MQSNWGSNPERTCHSGIRLSESRTRPQGVEKASGPNVWPQEEMVVLVLFSIKHTFCIFSIHQVVFITTLDLVHFFGLVVPSPRGPGSQKAGFEDPVIVVSGIQWITFHRHVVFREHLLRNVKHTLVGKSLEINDFG